MLRLLLLPLVFFRRPQAALHATFGRAQAQSLCRHWAIDQVHAPEPLARVRLALEHPSSFMVVAMHPSEASFGFVCRPTGPETHRIEAVVWPPTPGASACFAALRLWYAMHYADYRLEVGRLQTEELRAWEA